MKLAVSVLATLLALPASGLSAERSSSVRAAFVRANPCPANGNTRGPCPGYIVDHIHPLCAGGRDHVGNMQWQTLAEAKAKDRDEIRLCRSQKRALQ